MKTSLSDYTDKLAKIIVKIEDGGFGINANAVFAEMATEREEIQKLADGGDLDAGVILGLFDRLQSHCTPEETDHKRVGPGQIEYVCEGRRYRRTNASRNLIDRTEQNLNTIDRGTIPTVSPSLAAAQRDDTAAAIQALAHGDDADIREMLAAQALTLDRAAHSVLLRAGVYGAKFTEIAIEMTERHYSLALRLSEQSRKSLKTLADVKSPRKTTFVKRQQNVLVADGANTNQPKQLGEANGSAAMDIEAATGTSGDMPQAEALEAQHRAAH